MHTYTCEIYLKSCYFTAVPAVPVQPTVSFLALPASVLFPVSSSEDPGSHNIVCLLLCSLLCNTHKQAQNCPSVPLWETNLLKDHDLLVVLLVFRLGVYSQVSNLKVPWFHSFVVRLFIWNIIRFTYFCLCSVLGFPSHFYWFNFIFWIWKVQRWFQN